MFKRLSANKAKKWLKLSLKNKDGTPTNFHVIDVTQEIFDDFIQFQMTHFARKELFHRIAGIPNNLKALYEYRNVLKNICSNKIYRNVICCPEANGIVVPEIAASVTTKLYRKSDRQEEFPVAKTKPVEMLYQLEHECNKLYSVSNLMKDHGVEIAVECTGLTVHPDYCKTGIATALMKMGPIWHKTDNNALGFAWATSEGTQKAAAQTGWLTEYTVKLNELANAVNVTSNNENSFVHLISFRF